MHTLTATALRATLAETRVGEVRPSWRESTRASAIPIFANCRAYPYTYNHIYNKTISKKKKKTTKDQISKWQFKNLVLAKEIKRDASQMLESQMFKFMDVLEKQQHGSHQESVKHV